MMRRFLFSTVHNKPARDITLIVGDSNADGRGTTVPSFVPVGALFNWNGASFDPITNQTVANDGPYGSIWQRYATDYFDASGTTVYLVNAAAGGSDVCPVGDNNDWSTTGTCYSAMQAKVANAIADAPGSEVTTIIINLMINDVRVPASIADITTHWNSLLDRLHDDFPTADILLINLGRIEAVAFNQLLVQVRDLVVDSAHARSYCHMITSGAFYVGISGGYNVDNLHYSQATNDSMGVNFSKWRRYANAGYSKWARSIIAAHHSDIDISFRTRIENLVATLGDDFIKLPIITPLYSDDTRNYLIDFTFRSYLVSGNAGFVQAPNGWMDTNNNVNNCIAAGYYTGFSNAGGSDGDDFNVLCVVGAIRTPAGTAAALFSRLDTGVTRVTLTQFSGVGNVNYFCNSLTARAYSDPDLLPDMLHSVGRLAGTEFYYQENIQVDSVVQAKTADLNNAIWFGCQSVDGVLSAPLDCDLGFIGAFPSSVDRANLVAAINAYLS